MTVRKESKKVTLISISTKRFVQLGAAAATSTSQSGASTPSVSTPPAYPNASAHPPSLQGHVKGGFSQPSHSSSMGHSQMGGPSTSMPNNQIGHDMGQGQRYNMCKYSE